MDIKLKDEISIKLPKDMPPAEKALATILVGEKLRMQAQQIAIAAIDEDIKKQTAIVKNRNGADDDRHYAGLALNALNDKLRHSMETTNLAAQSLQDVLEACAAVGPHIKIAADKCYDALKVKEAAR